MRAFRFSRPADPSPPEEWAGVFGNPLMASAALDRLTHHSHLLILEGESYRQRDRKTKKT